MISKENAYKSVANFIASNVSEGFDFDNTQVDAIVKFLQGAVKVDIVMLPEAVLPFVEKLFPREDDASKQQQDVEEIKKVVDRYAASGHWEKVAIGYATPWSAGGKGIGSKANFMLLATAIRDFIATGQRLRVDHVAEIVYTLASRGVLERVPQTVAVEKPVPPPPPPSERDLHNQQVARDRAMNDPSTSPLKGAKEAAKLLVNPKPVLTEEQRLALNEQKRADGAVIAEAQHRISTFTGRSHSHTYSGRAELTEVFKSAMDEVSVGQIEVKEVLRRVDAKIDQLAGNSSIR